MYPPETRTLTDAEIAAGLFVYSVEYNEHGKPEVRETPVLSSGKSRLYITEKRVNGCKDVDYVQMVEASTGKGLCLASYKFSWTADGAMQTWLERAKHDIVNAHNTVRTLSVAFAALGLDARGEEIAPEPRVPVKATKGKSLAVKPPKTTKPKKKA